MIFRISDCGNIEINTLAELKAFALGGTGKIEINYVETHPMTGVTYQNPSIKQKGTGDDNN